MSDRPLIIKSTFFNIRPEKMEEVRKIIKKQMEEPIPVVMLPCGFELAEVNVEMLKEIKSEIVLLQSKYKYNSETEYYKVGRCEAHEEDLEIIDKRIKELKGENKWLEQRKQAKENKE